MVLLNPKLKVIIFLIKSGSEVVPGVEPRSAKRLTVNGATSEDVYH